MASLSRIRNGIAWSLVFIQLFVLFHVSNFLTLTEAQCHHHHANEGEESHNILEDDADDQLIDTVTSIGGTALNETLQEDASPQIHRDTPCGKRVSIKGGKFLMGSEDKSAYPMDGESPVREMTVGDFEMSACETTNEEFQRFVDATNYTTEAEAFGWSFVFMYFVSDETLEKITQAVAAAPHWVPVEGADWRHPEEPQSNITNRMDHPVVHVSWNDAKRYCEWAGGRLPTEKEWEYAARGGLEGKRYPWGDETVPRGTKGEPVYKCNFFQGRFPEKNTGADGYLGTAPASAYEPNGYGLYNVAGNVWEWCEDDWSIDHSPIGQQRKVLSQRQQQQQQQQQQPQQRAEEVRKVQKGGSYMCHVRVCHRFRPAARMGNTPDSSGGNLGFRCLWDVAGNLHQ